MSKLFQSPLGQTNMNDAKSLKAGVGYIRKNKPQFRLALSVLHSSCEDLQELLRIASNLLSAQLPCV